MLCCFQVANVSPVLRAKFHLESTSGNHWGWFILGHVASSSLPLQGHAEDGRFGQSRAGPGAVPAGVALGIKHLRCGDGILQGPKSTPWGSA